MKVLITGVAGFLGSHLAAHYLNKQCTVVGIDDHSSSLGPDSPHLQRLREYQKFTFLEHDITDVETFREECFDRYDFDLILNFACPASPPRYQAMPVHTTMTCVLGVKNVLDYATRCGARVIQASTSEVYGDPVTSPQNETDWGNVNSYGPRSCYDEGKRCAEALCYDYRHRYGVDVKVIRIFNTYGQNMDPDDGRVVTNFIKQALTDKEITVYGSGDQTRSFCYVDDLCDGIIRVAMSDRSVGGPVNLGNPGEFTIDELAAYVLELIPDSRSTVVYKDLPMDDPRQRRPNIELANRALGWTPRVDLSEGLKRTIKYMEEMRHLFDRSWTCHKA